MTPGALVMGTDEDGNPIVAQPTEPGVLVAPEESEAAVEGFDEQLRLIAAEQPEQTAEMLKVWLEEPAETVEEKAA